MPRAQTVLLSESELAEHTIYKILMQQSSIKGIRVTIKQELWHDRDDLDSLPPIIDGTIFAWISKKAGTVNVDWFDGRETLPLRLALKEEYEFKLISNANGGPPPTPLRGAALVLRGPLRRTSPKMSSQEVSSGSSWTSGSWYFERYVASCSLVAVRERSVAAMGGGEREDLVV